MPTTPTPSSAPPNPPSPPGPPVPPGPPTGMDPRLGRAWGRSALAMVGAVVLAVVLAVPFYPRDDTSGWAGLGWAIGTAVAAAALALVAGAVALWLRLRREGAPYAGQVALAFLPVAVLLAAMSAGLGALLAPPVAWWLVRGLHRPAQPGWGAGTGGPMARLTATGVWPRAALALVLMWGITVWVLTRWGHRLGGEVHGEWLVLACCLPGLVLVPALLLARRAWWLALGLALVGTVLAWFAVLDATSRAHLSAERLGREVAAVGTPAGTTRTGTEAGDARGRSGDDYGYDLPVLAVGADAPVPSGLVAGDAPTGAAPGTDAGVVVAGRWADDLEAAGWERVPSPGQVWQVPQVERFVARPGVQTLELGTWVTGWVVPVGDGAVLYVVTRA